MLEPLRNSAMISSSNDVMNARNAADMIAGLICGNVTVKTARRRLAPSPIAACSCDTSKFLSAALTTSTTNGIA